MPLTILSLNTNGLNHPDKRRSLWKTATTLHSDILCVQETHLLPSSSSLCSSHQFPHVFNSTKSKGVMIAIRDTVDSSNVLLDPEGRYIILTCTINRAAYTLINVFALNSHQMKFLHKVLCISKPIQKGHLVICGDVKLVPDIVMHSTSAAKRRDLPLKKFISAQDLFNVWRCHHGSERDFTYYSSRHNSCMRIDLFLTAKSC